MRVSDIDVSPVSVPAAKQLQASNDVPADTDYTYDHLIVRVNLADGTRGYGEIAPHPNWPRSGTQVSRESIVEIGLNQLRREQIFII